ncbi:MAG: hypothetical protein AAB368_11205, partial [bacterium]
MLYERRRGYDLFEAETRGAIGRVAGVAQEMARYGLEVSDDSLQRWLQRSFAIEHRAVNMAQRVNDQ